MSKQPTTQNNNYKPWKGKTTRNRKRDNDWTCLLCNNLNFSFRTNCNRCRIQSKKKNQIESQLFTYTQRSDHSLEHAFINNFKSSSYYVSYQQCSLSANEFKTSLTPSEQQGIKKTYSEKLGFNNILFLTPKGQKIDPEDDQDVGKPYVSPKNLPSLEPLLKKLKAKYSF